MSLRPESLAQTTNCTGYQWVRSIRQFLISQNKPCLHIKHMLQFYPWMAVIPRRNKKRWLLVLILMASEAVVESSENKIASECSSNSVLYRFEDLEIYIAVQLRLYGSISRKINFRKFAKSGRIHVNGSPRSRMVTSGSKVSPTSKPTIFVNWVQVSTHLFVYK